ncbi:BMP family ABC transporter substrate-binding protein [Spiroplasma endosymbiont of Virgichneumon dumeticola]|uniref:BMP family ABC transporter substrate-binding protein n=1 Tax=Spiroplasma endosymbiont of Virgichneumon dumeticola TaxID=3139323 RepID=UPI0035C8D8EB
MKTFLRVASAALLISSSTAGLTGCSISSIGDVWIITDGGDLFDKAFNQQVLEGVQEFTDNFNKNRPTISKLPGNENWQNQEMRCRWIISSDADVSTLQNNYNLAAFAGAKTIVLAGFHHLEALTPKIQNFYKALGIRFILVDAQLENPIDVASLTYSAEQSGFLAGLAGAIWLVANHEAYDSNGLKMSTFGGLPAQTIVSYMMGYYWGVYYFNNYRANPDLLKMVNALRDKTNPMSSSDFTSKYKISFDKIAKQFTGGFESGTKDSKSITSQLIDGNHEDIVMPVAGAQTIDLLSAIKNSSKNSNAKVIGVDVDQTKQYDYAKNTFLTSALKGIHASVSNWLWYAFNLDYKPPLVTPSDGSKYFDGTEPQVALGQGYTGISDNDAINVIYQNLVSAPYELLAQKVTTAFNVLSNDLATNPNSSKWEDAWQTKIDEKELKYKPKF